MMQYLETYCSLQSVRLGDNEYQTPEKSTSDDILRTYHRGIIDDD